MAVRIIEKHINDFAPDRESYRRVIQGCFERVAGTQGGAGLQLLAKGEHDVLIEHYLSPTTYVECPYIRLISKKTGEIYRMVDPDISWGSIDHHLREMGVDVFYTHYYKNGSIFHKQGDLYIYRKTNKWKVIWEYPAESKVQIRTCDENGQLKVTDIERVYGVGNAEPEEWLAILEKSEKKEDNLWLSICGKSYQYTPEYCASLIEDRQKQ